MELNLIDIVKSQLGGSIITKAASFLGENGAATQKALDVLLPSVLGGMANQATTLSGADNLLGLINKGGHDGSIFNTLGSLLGDGAETNDLLKNGGKVVSTLFGENVSDIAHWVASHTGIKSGSAWSLMNLSAPILMGAISQNMDSSRSASSLVGLLGSQLPILKKMIPTELVGVLGLSQLNMTPPAVQKEVPKQVKTTPKPIAKTINEEAKTSNLDKPLVKNLMPWLLLLGAALVGLFYLRSCKSQKLETPSTASAPVVEPPKTNADRKSVV